MELVTTIVQVWLTLAVLTLFGFIGSEMLAVQSRGPEYLLWVKQNMTQRSTTSWLGIALRWLLGWPVVLYLIIRASFKQQTLMEYIILSEQEKQKKLDASMKWQRENDGKMMPAFSTWHHKGCGKEGDVYLLTTHYLPLTLLPRKNGESPAAAELRVSHVLLHAAGGEFVIIFRAMPDDNENLPYGLHRTLEGAKKLCLQDEEWAELCAPGREEKRREAWGLIKERLDTAGGLDE